MPYRALLLAICISYLGIVEAQAQGSQVDADLHCLAVMAKINQLPGAKHQLESLIGGYYYLGRLQAAAPNLDLGQSTADAYKQMSAADFLSETSRCEGEMRTKGHTITEIGGAMPHAPNTDSNNRH